jgi:hypothetical protein
VRFRVFTKSGKNLKPNQLAHFPKKRETLVVLLRKEKNPKNTDYIYFTGENL